MLGFNNTKIVPPRNQLFKYLTRNLFFLVVSYSDSKQESDSKAICSRDEGSENNDLLTKNSFEALFH